MTEQQNIEYKESWHDEYLKWIGGFANAQGGRIFIGIDDRGEVIGVPDYIKLMDSIPNKAINHLGLAIDVNLQEKSGKYYIEIGVPISEIPISYHGVYYYRSGSTKQELKGIALQNLLLKKIGRRWEDIPIPKASMNELNEKTIRSFIKKSIDKGRIPVEVANDSLLNLLSKLKLINREGYLTNAALLLFGRDPASITVTAAFKIGRFGNGPDDLLFQDIIETNIFDMVDEVLETLKKKYLIRPISYKGWERMEPLEYPESALREAVLNAIIHKDYSSTWTFLRVYDDRLTIWNPGRLPEELTLEMLRSDHSSYPRNENIADVFFKAGYIEAWGRGINNIINACMKAGLPEPIVKEEQGGFSITFLKSIYTEEYLKNLGLNERQMQTVFFVEKNLRITNRQYQELFKVSRNTASNDLRIMVKFNILSSNNQKGAGSVYTLATITE